MPDGARQLQQLHTTLSSKLNSQQLSEEQDGIILFEEINGILYASLSNDSSGSSRRKVREGTRLHRIFLERGYLTPSQKEKALDNMIEELQPKDELDSLVESQLQRRKKEEEKLAERQKFESDFGVELIVHHRCALPDPRGMTSDIKCKCGRRWRAYEADDYGSKRYKWSGLGMNNSYLQNASNYSFAAKMVMLSYLAYILVAIAVGIFISVNTFMGSGPLAVILALVLFIMSATKRDAASCKSVSEYNYIYRQ